MDDLNLGRLEPVDIDTVWDNEPAGFTPWLARAENLGTLGAALGLRLELEAQEMAVGALRRRPRLPGRRHRPAGADREPARPLRPWPSRPDHRLRRRDRRRRGDLAGAPLLRRAPPGARLAERDRRGQDPLLRPGDRALEDRRFARRAQVRRRLRPRERRGRGGASGAWPPAGPAPRGLGHRTYWRAFMQVLDSAGGPITGGRRPPDCAKTQFHIGRHGFRIVASTTTLEAACARAALRRGQGRQAALRPAPARQGGDRGGDRLCARMGRDAGIAGLPGLVLSARHRPGRRGRLAAPARLARPSAPTTCTAPSSAASGRCEGGAPRYAASPLLGMRASCRPLTATPHPE